MCYNLIILQGKLNTGNSIMVTVPATRAYLRITIGLGNDAEGEERANAIIEEGLDDLSEIGELADNEGIKTLCSSVRKPAGTMPQPGWQAPDPNPNQLTAPSVPRIGKVIPVICEQRLALAAYGAAIYRSIGRNVEPAILNRVRLREFKLQKATVDNHNDPDPLPEISKTFNIMKFLDQLPTYLQQVLGVKKVALAYLVRKTNPPENLPDLIGGGAGKPWCSEHESLMEELVAYTPHSGPAYNADNAQLYNLLSAHLGNTSAMASVTRHARRRDSRAAYNDLVTHNMGSAKWEKTVEAAERVLTSRIWNGKNARYPLRIHIARHREAFNDLKRAEMQITYTAPNETSRVRYLLTSIQTSDPTICSGKTTIQADTGKRDNFEEAADFLMTICPPPKPVSHPVQRVSAIKSSKRGKIRIGPKTRVEVRFYKKQEWEKLTREQQREVRDLRRQQMKRKADDDGDRRDSAKIAALEAKVEEEERMIASLKTTDGNGSVLPPRPKSNPLKPPIGFTQRGE